MLWNRGKWKDRQSLHGIKPGPKISFFLTLHNSDKSCEAALVEVLAGKILCFYNGMETFSLHFRGMRFNTSKVYAPGICNIIFLVHRLTEWTQHYPLLDFSDCRFSVFHVEDNEILVEYAYSLILRLILTLPNLDFITAHSSFITAQISSITPLF